MRRQQLGKFRFCVDAQTVAIFYKRYLVIGLSWWRRFEIVIGTDLTEEASYSPALLDICLRLGRMSEHAASGVSFVLEIGRRVIIGYTKLIWKKENRL